MEIFERVRFIDLFFLILCLRIIYISILKGLVCEGFKVAGLLVGSLLAFQYYPFLTGKITNLRILSLNTNYISFICFLAILLGVGIVFSLLRLVVTILLKDREISVAERRLLFFIGGFRAAFLASVIIFLLHLSPLNSQYFSKGMSHGAFKKIAPKIYLGVFRIYSKFDSRTTLNSEVRDYCESR